MAEAKPKKDEKKAQKAEAKFTATPELRKVWVRVRQSWVTSHAAFSYGLSMLNKSQSEMLYDLVRRALYKNSAGEVLKAHPEIKEFMRSDDDRMCMIDVYETLSWKLNRKEEPPSDIKMAKKFTGMLRKRSDNPFF